MARPKKQAPDTRTIGARVSTRLWNRLRAKAFQQGITAGEALDEAIKLYLGGTTKRTKPSSNRTQLVKAAEELNKKLGLDPPIEPDADEQVLKDAILEAAELIEEDDQIGEATIKLINRLKGGA